MPQHHEEAEDFSCAIWDWRVASNHNVIVAEADDLSCAIWDWRVVSNSNVVVLK